MPELIILELLAGLFLFLPAARMPSRSRYPLEGIVCLPPLALLIVTGIFPAYGFRPECLPLLVCCVMGNVANSAPLSALLTRVHAAPSRRRWLPLFSTVLTVGFAVFFVPRAETRLLTEGVRSFTLTDRARNNTLVVRMYGAEDGPEKPLLLVAPPVSASIAAVDHLCGALRDAGFTVLTWSRRGFDLVATDEAGKRRHAPFRQSAAILRALFWGRIYAGANEAGRALEAGRRAEVEFLLSYLSENGGLPEAGSPDAGPPASGGAGARVIFAAGLGAGGAALLDLATDAETAARFPALRGVIALESPPLQTFRPLPEAADHPPALQTRRGPRAIISRLTGWFRALIPRRAADTGEAPAAVLPVCIVAASRIRATGTGDRYAALIRYFHAASAPAALVSVDGMGVLDYGDLAWKYPVVALPFRGPEAPAWSGAAVTRNTAALTAHFAARVLAASGMEARAVASTDAVAEANAVPEAQTDTDEAAGEAPRHVPPGDSAAQLPALPPLASRGVVIETNGVWNSRGWGSILTP